MWYLKENKDRVNVNINANDMENMENIYARCAKCVDDMLAKEFLGYDEVLIRMNVTDDTRYLAEACLRRLKRNYAQDVRFFDMLVDNSEPCLAGYYIRIIDKKSLWFVHM